MAARTNGSVTKVKYKADGSGATATVNWPDPPPDGTDEDIPVTPEAADRFLDAMGDGLQVDGEPPQTGQPLTAYTFHP